MTDRDLGHRRFRVIAVSAVAMVATASTAPAQEYLDRPVGPAYCEAETDRIPVLLLGSYHMANPGADMFSQLVIDHPGYCLEDPLPYLEGL